MAEKKERRLTHYEIDYMIKHGTTIKTRIGYQGKETGGEPISEEFRKELIARQERVSNRIRIIHKCYQPKFKRKVAVEQYGYSDRKNLNFQFSTEVSIPRPTRKVLLKFTKLTDHWWEKFPEVYKCEGCGFELTREEVASTYFIHVVGGK